MSEEEHANKTADDIHNLIATYFREHEGAMITKWMLQVEIIDKDGSESLWTLASPSMSLWDRLGIAEYLKMHYHDIFIRTRDEES